MTKSIKLYFASLFILGALIMLGLSSLSRGPAPKGINAPTDQFSAMRAFADLKDWVGNNKAHPSGSAENLRIRKLIENKFSALGYAPEIQSALGCTPHYPGCTQVENIIVRHKGTGSGEAIMLTTHYDSVPAGPAAADDGAGTAALLEVARIIKSGVAFKNDIIFLITDGEEGGLRGAFAFAQQHPMMSDVKLVVNLESRGASGPSTMFETSDGNQNLIARFASTNPHPVANSLSYEVYKRLPNDTDYSIYKKMNVAGLNYAFTGDVALYHSLRDDVEHLDKTSLQHHGENMLAAVQAFGNADLNALIGKNDATYIDVFGKFLLRWPSKFNIPLALFSLLILGFAAFRAGMRAKPLAVNLAAALAICALTPALGWLLSFPLGHWPDLFYLDHPHPWPGRLAMIFGALFVAWAVSSYAKKWTSYNGLVWAAGIMFTLLAIALAIFMPGAAYLSLLPALGLSTGALIDIWCKHQRFTVAAHIGLLIAAYMAYYHFIAFEVIASYKASYLRIAPLVLLGLAVMPLFAGKAERRTTKLFGMAMLAIMAIFTVISAMLPGFNISHPRAQNLVYIQGHETDKAIWISETSGKQDQEFLAAAGFTKPYKPKNLLGISWGRMTAKPAPPANYTLPSYTLQGGSVTGGIRTIIMDIQSTHGGYALNLGFERDQAPQMVTINGHLAADYKDKPYRRPIAIRGPKNDVFRIVIKTAADKPLNMALIDTFSLSEDQTDGMAELRSEISAPLHSGDRAHIFNLIKFPCAEHCT